MAFGRDRTCGDPKDGAERAATHRTAELRESLKSKARREDEPAPLARHLLTKVDISFEANFSRIWPGLRNDLRSLIGYFR